MVSQRLRSSSRGALKDCSSVIFILICDLDPDLDLILTSISGPTDGTVYRNDTCVALMAQRPFSSGDLVN